MLEGRGTRPCANMCVRLAAAALWVVVGQGNTWQGMTIRGHAARREVKEKAGMHCTFRHLFARLASLGASVNAGGTKAYRCLNGGDAIASGSIDGTHNPA
ncbi:hypothetical protein TRVL_03842 [Trypanosoma vivax]|nr:hypothetical protein TRVL_03842 [Trypanosoma vivax]